MSILLQPSDVQNLEPYEIDLLALAVGTDNPEQIRNVVNSYQYNALFLYRPVAKTVGIIGLETIAQGDARIRHIAADPANQRTGIGRILVNACIAELEMHILRAETDADAVGFYAATGFHVQSLGEKYPGVERFECTRNS